MSCRIETQGDLATITLDSPGRKNAMQDKDWRELGRLLRGVAGDNEVRVVVIEGAGDDFCAGADLATDSVVPSPVHRLRLITEVTEALLALPQPSIAKVRGVAVGAGNNVAIGCDFVVASEEARFSQIFVRRGLGLDAGGSWLLPRLVGLRRAKELALLGDIVTAKEACEFGLINQVVGSADLDSAVHELARRLAAGPPIAMAVIKRTLHESIGPSLASSLALEEYSQSVNLATEDFGEAVSAFLERRQPTYQGK